MSAPRVLVCGTTLAQPMSGVRRHNQELLPRLAKLLSQRSGSLAVLASASGLPFELPAAIEVHASKVPARPALARAAWESLALRGALERARAAGTPFDVVHTDHLPAPRGLTVPFTLTLHDLKSVTLASAPLARRIVGRRVIADAVRRAAAVFAVSRTLREEVRELTGAPTGKLHVVPNGCDHLPLDAREPATPPFLLVVGHLEPRKNIESVLRALALDSALPELRLAGAGANEAALRRLADELGVAARVRYLGLQSDAQLARLYATCACVVLPSLREGFDIPLAEALRAGAPVATSSLPVHRELAPNAASFDPNDAAECARAIHAAAATNAQLATWDEAASAWLVALESLNLRATPRRS